MAVRSAIIENWNPPVSLRLEPLVVLTDERLYEFCQLNRDLRIERTAEGVLVLMAPAGADSSARNARLTHRLISWAEQDGTGIAFDSSAGFLLPNGALRSPDAAWVRRDRWLAQSLEARQRFPQLCPDFVVELRSPSDKLAGLQRRLREYIRNGARLSWLIDPGRRTVHVYRPDAAVQLVARAASISADPVLRGFALDLDTFW